MKKTPNTSASFVVNDLSQVELVKKGDQKAFEFLYNKYYKLLVGYVVNLNKNVPEAEDIVQQTFIKVWEKLTTKQDLKIMYFNAWIHKISYNLFINHYRSMKNHRKIVSLDGLVNTTISTDMIPKWEFSHDIQYCLNKLTPVSKEIVLLYFFQGMSYDQIRKFLGEKITHQSYISRTHNAVMRLRSILGVKVKK
jgi:RNA polymerase sigma factor (sigma-70 family)